MTGIKRLRALAYKKNFLEPAEARELDHIADQIEREARDPAADVSMSAYDLLPADERDAIAWVREHGGLDHVRSQWGYLKGRANHADHVDRQLEKRQRQIDECHGALRRRNQRIAVLASEINRAHSENRMEFLRRAGNYTAFADEVCKRLAPQLRCVEGCTKDVMDAALEALDSRLMPEDCEWPRYESGEMVEIGDEVVGPDYGESIRVDEITFHANGFTVREKTGLDHWYESDDRFERPKVLAADGEPLEVGQTVWDVDGYGPLVVKELPLKGEQLVVLDNGGTNFYRYPEKLTNKRPDSWERIEEDARGLDSGVDRELFTHTHEDLVRRCRVLAERERGE